jgi:hypothetical protein
MRKSTNVLLLAMSGYLDKVTTERGYNGVECARLKITELESSLASLRAGIEKLAVDWRERANERVRLVGAFHSAARQTYDICADELSTLQEPK